MRCEDGGGQRRKGAGMREEGEEGGRGRKTLCGGKKEQERRHTSLLRCSRRNYTIYTATTQGRPPQGHFSLTTGPETQAQGRREGIRQQHEEEEEV